jgi:hypothetical protein
MLDAGHCGTQLLYSGAEATGPHLSQNSMSIHVSDSGSSPCAMSSSSSNAASASTRTGNARLQ